MAADDLEPKTDTIVETEHYMVWQAEEPDDETTYHLELNTVTIHFYREEWDEFLNLMRDLLRKVK